MPATLDFIVLFAYLAFILIVGLRAARGQHLEGYLVNRRKTSLWLLTFSNIATLIGAGAIVGVASAAYATGISYAIPVLVGELVGVALLALAASRIKAFGDSHKAHTLGDFFEHRFGHLHRSFAAILLVLLLLLWAAIQFAAMAQLLKVLLGLDFEVAIIAATIVTILYTSLAGIISDMLTDFWQFWVILLMFVVLIPVAWVRTGGFASLAALPAGHFDPLAFGGAGFLIGGVLLAGFVILANVSYWQRIYSADSVDTARKSFWYSIPFAVLFVAAAALAGLFAAVLLPGLAPDTSLFALMGHLLPPGLLGLAYAGILAVAMSSVDSLLLGGSATIMKDLYLPTLHKMLFKHRKAHEHELLNMTRYMTAVFGVVGAGIAFLIPDIVQLSILAASTALAFVPSVIAGLFWKRATAAGGIASLVGSVAVLFVLTPFMPKLAFLPSIVTGITLLVAVSLVTRKSL